MGINYGSLGEPKPRKKREKSLIVHEQAEDRSTPEALENRLINLAFQNRAPSVAKAAALDLLERKAPRQKNVEQGLTADEARRITDIYDTILGSACPHCVKERC